jgi:5-methylcytosine-specific restriction endonuclease McrA
MAVARYVPLPLKWEVIRRDEGRCRYCGIIPDRRRRTLDHVIPWGQGGGHSLDNLVVACRSCNMKKQSRTPEEAGMPLLPLSVVPDGAAECHDAHASPI